MSVRSTPFKLVDVATLTMAANSTEASPTMSTPTNTSEMVSPASERRRSRTGARGVRVCGGDGGTRACGRNGAQAHHALPEKPADAPEKPHAAPPNKDGLPMMARSQTMRSTVVSSSRCKSAAGISSVTR